MGPLNLSTGGASTCLTGRIPRCHTWNLGLTTVVNSNNQQNLPPARQILLSYLYPYTVCTACTYIREIKICNGSTVCMYSHTSNFRYCQNEFQDFFFLISLSPSLSLFFLLEVGDTRVGTVIVATIYLQLIQNRYMFRSFTVFQCSRQHCVQPIASDVEVVGYL
jgi:hypothetical protein